MLKPTTLRAKILKWWKPCLSNGMIGPIKPMYFHGFGIKKSPLKKGIRRNNKIVLQLLTFIFNFLSEPEVSATVVINRHWIPLRQNNQARKSKAQDVWFFLCSLCVFASSRWKCLYSSKIFYCGDTWQLTRTQKSFGFLNCLGLIEKSLPRLGFSGTPS